jgi:hypothetical protein
LPIKFNIPIRKNKNIFIQTQCNVNLMFKSKKGNEVKTYTPPPEKVKKPKGATQEIALSKFNSLLEVDELSR